MHDRVIKVKAPGKCILFGEHAVVFGYPAIAIAINQFSYCHIERGKTPGISLILKDFNIHYLIPRIPLEKQIVEDRFKQYEIGLTILVDRYNIEMEALQITIFSDLWPGAGLGSSASAGVAFLTALNIFYELHLSKQIISDLAFEMEREVHGHPSGIDNTVCTFGSMIFFQQGQKESLPVPPNFPILLTYSGKPHNTKEAVAKVHLLRTKNPESTALLFQNIGNITQTARIVDPASVLSGSFHMIARILQCVILKCAIRAGRNTKIHRIEDSMPNRMHALTVAHNLNFGTAMARSLRAAMTR